MMSFFSAQLRRARRFKQKKSVFANSISISLQGHDRRIFVRITENCAYFSGNPSLRLPFGIELMMLLNHSHG